MRILDFILNLRNSMVGILKRGVTRLNLGLMISGTTWRTNGFGWGTGLEVERSVKRDCCGLVGRRHWTWVQVLELDDVLGR